jgi:uncharacterized protein (TIGR02996 family)
VDAQALIDAIVRDPDAEDGWLRYADWLLDRGDPRGELIVWGKREDAAAASDSLLSPRLAAQAHFWHLRWRRGFVHTAQLIGAPDDPAGVEAIEALFADPHAGLLRELSLLLPWSEQDLFDVAMAVPRPTLRTLRVSGAVELGDAFERGAPALDRLILGAWSPSQLDLPAGVGQLAHSRLRELESDAASCAAACHNRVAVPSLEVLRWRPIPNDPLFAAGSMLHDPPPRLRTLRLEVCPSTIVRPLVACPALGRLRALALSTSVVHPHDVMRPTQILEDLLAEARSFAHLERLEIGNLSVGRLEAAVVDDLRARFAAALPRTEVVLDWDALVVQVGPRRAPATFDTQSRGPDGRIDAIGMFSSKRRP